MTFRPRLAYEGDPDQLAYDRVKAWLEDRAWAVAETDLVAEMGPEEEFTTGMARPSLQLVQINTHRPRTLVQRLHTLVHEAGHVLSILRGYALSEYARDELKAHYYGWAVARRLEVSAITKTSWRRFNYQFPPVKEALAA